MIVLAFLYSLVVMFCFVNSLLERSARQEGSLRATQILMIGVLSLAWPLVVPALAFAVTRRRAR